MSVGLLVPLHEWDGFETACEELRACSVDTSRFLDAEMAELNRWQTTLHKVLAASAAAASHRQEALQEAPSGETLKSHRTHSAAEPGEGSESSAHRTASSELVERLETLCDRIEGGLRRDAILSDSDLTTRLGQEESDKPAGSVSAAQADASSKSYRRRLRALAEQVLILERNRCGAAAELAAARLRARQLTRELKRQKNAFSRERQRWLRKLSAIERSLARLGLPDESTALRRELPTDHGMAPNAGLAKSPTATLTDELLIEAIMTRCEMSPEGRAC